MIMRISEQEKKDILSKYSDDTSDELLNHLKRHFPVTEVDSFFGNKYKFIKVDDKSRPLYANKKYLVSKISSLVEDEWASLGTQMIRRTVKKYLDGVMAS